MVDVITSYYTAYNDSRILVIKGTFFGIIPGIVYISDLQTKQKEEGIVLSWNSTLIEVAVNPGAVGDVRVQVVNHQGWIKSVQYHLNVGYPNAGKKTRFQLDKIETFYSL